MRMQAAPAVSPWPATLLRWLLLPFLLVMAAMAVVGAPLVTAAAPRGIVSLEFCAFTASCAAMLQSWQPAQREAAMLSLGLDYLYMALYPTVIASALLVLAAAQAAPVRRAARLLAGLVAGAGLADAVENLGLIRLLQTGTADGLTTLAAVCASAKFAVLAVALLALLGLAAAWLLQRLRGTAG